MGAWLCDCCGCKTENPHVEWDRDREFWGFPAAERFYFCPQCGEPIAFDEEAELEDTE